MKMQMTLVATAISLALSGAAFADDKTPNPTTITAKSSLSVTHAWGVDVDWGVDKLNSSYDNNAWGTSQFGSAQAQMSSLSLNGTQSSVAGDNKNNSVIQQNGGSNNQAAVAQLESGNESLLTQNGGDSNKAHVVQIHGKDNFSTVLQELGTGNGIVNVLQNGANESNSFIEQYGAEGNKADVEQTATRVDSRIVQGTVGGSEINNQALVSQSGQDSQSHIEQFSSNNYATVNQSGVDNESYIRQELGDHNYADVQQAGSDGISQVLQQGGFNVAFLNQQGTLNESYILQNSTSSSNTGNYADVTQSGSSNISTITQVGTAVGHAVVTQIGGTGNWASTIQN